MPAFAVSNAVHVVDLVTFEERYFTDGFFIQNVGQAPYMDAVIVQKLPLTDSGRAAIYYAMDVDGNEICELGSTLDTENLIGQITRTDGK